ncbi:MAG: four-carbon acid sugar kinase family protein [Microbacterium sp.]
MSGERVPTVVGLVADDLTGAADAAVGFAEHGWHSEVVLGAVARTGAPDGAGHAVLLAVSTEARHAETARARERTRDAVHALRRAGAERLFVKIDSTMRGSVAAQIEGALQAWSRPGAAATAVICPAFPAHGRVVADGRLHVGGAPVHLTAAGVDPVAPVATSALSELLPGAVPGELAEAGHERMLVLDATTESDLGRVAAAVSEAADTTIAVGSGGLAAALADRWRSEGHPPPLRAASGSGVLFAVSSLHPVSTAQIVHVRDRLGADDGLLTPGDELLADPVAAAEMLADRVLAALTEHRFRAIVLVGGDGAAAVLARLNAERLVIGSQVLRGCPRATVVGGPADGTTVVTKSGGFGNDATLSVLLDLLGSASGAGPVDVLPIEGTVHDPLA